MATRTHTHEEQFNAVPERVFTLLHTPSAICEWWGAARAIVVPSVGGVWAAAWGADEDDPDYVTTCVMRIFEPPRRILFADYAYHVRSGPLPFSASFSTEFTIKAHEDGCILRVDQDGFPLGPEADDFYAACERGWRDTFNGIRAFLDRRR